MPEFALIACRVTSETKARVRRLAERDGITESTLLRQLLDVVLRTAGLDDPPAMTVRDKVNRDARVNVRLEPEDWQLLREREGPGDGLGDLPLLCRPAPPARCGAAPKSGVHASQAVRGSARCPRAESQSDRARNEPG